MAPFTNILALALAAAAATAAPACGSKSGGPTDAPTATAYGRGAYAWADAMVPWNCTYNIRDFAGSADAAFAAAQAAAVRAGGGVVYFPPGTYVFTQNLTIASNIVIRGAPVSGAQAKSGKSPGNLKPTTVFECPNRAHMGIWNFDPQATNIGIVNVLLDQCAVMFWPGLKTASYEPMLSNYWFQASDVAGMGSNKLVLGNVVRDVSYGKSLLSKGNYTYPYIFSIAVSVYSDKNALIANNLLPASARKETTTLPWYPGAVPYAYDNRYGIDVNTVLLGAVASNYCKGPGSKCGTASAFGGLSPACAPFNFRTGLEIRDNYVHQNGRVGISWTGGADAAPTCQQGSATQVVNNHVEVQAGTTCYYISGDRVPGGSDTNENRGCEGAPVCGAPVPAAAHARAHSTHTLPYTPPHTHAATCCPGTART